MGIEIIKCARDEDLYLEWDHRDGDEPISAVGTRTEMLEHLAEQEHSPGNQPEDRLQRADRRGTSMLDRSGCGGWNSTGVIYRQRGFLPRARFTEFARRFLAYDEVGMIALLEPLETETAP